MARIYMVCHVLADGNAGFPTRIFAMKEDAHRFCVEVKKTSSRVYIVHDCIVIPDKSRDLAHEADMRAMRKEQLEADFADDPEFDCDFSY